MQWNLGLVLDNENSDDCNDVIFETIARNYYGSGKLWIGSNYSLVETRMR